MLHDNRKSNENKNKQTEIGILIIIIFSIKYFQTHPEPT